MFVMYLAKAIMVSLLDYKALCDGRMKNNLPVTANSGIWLVSSYNNIEFLDMKIDIRMSPSHWQYMVAMLHLLHLSSFATKP